MATLKLVIVLLTVCFSFTVFSWGPNGHRIVGEIAERELNPTVKSAIRLLLNNDSLARISTWPDEIKSDPDNYRHTFSWHYMTWPTTQEEYEYDGEGELINSIDEQLKILNRRNGNITEKVTALKFLVHLIGDLHQPLHVGNGYDMGGNSCQVIFHGERVNLHSLWDEKLIDKMDLSFTEYVEMLMDKKLVYNERQLTKDVLSWAKESKILREEIYPAEVDKPKRPDRNNMIKDYCRRDIDLADAEIPNLGYKYSYDFNQKMEERLLLAGLRLGRLLNTAFSN